MRVVGLLLWVGTVVWAQDVPAWQTAAGGAMAFDVATVRLSEPGKFSPPSFPLSADDSFKNTGGEFSADFPLEVYINFAYKLGQNPEQNKAMEANMPKQVLEARFTVHAKGPATATKDQMRLMVQDLLRERFGFKAHFEMKSMDVLELTLKKPGLTGPKLRPHSEGPKCLEEGGEAMAKDVFPVICSVYGARPAPDRQILMGSRNTTMELFAAQAIQIARLGKMVVDRTGLTGRWDFTMEFAQQGAGIKIVSGNPAEPAPEASQGPTFLEALDDQLGLKLKPGKATLPVLVVDHVEMPSGN